MSKGCYVICDDMLQYLAQDVSIDLTDKTKREIRSSCLSGCGMKAPQLRKECVRLTYEAGFLAHVCNYFYWILTNVG